MGQTIDMLASKAAANEDTSPSLAMSEVEQAAEKERLAKEREERLRKIRTELESMSASELLQAVLKYQQDRVSTYNTYERYVTIHIRTRHACGVQYANPHKRIVSAGWDDS